MITVAVMARTVQLMISGILVVSEVWDFGWVGEGLMKGERTGREKRRKRAESEKEQVSINSYTYLP